MIAKDKYAKLIQEHSWWFPPWNSLVNGVLSSVGKTNIKEKQGYISADFHIHSIYSNCSISKPEDIIKRAVSIGLSCIGIMDHNTIDGALSVFEIAEELKQKGEIPQDFTVVIGCEVSSNSKHIGALFVDKKPPQDLSIDETIQSIKEMGGISVAVHPFHRTGVGEDFYKYDFDAVETRCGSIFNKHIIKKHFDLENDSKIEQMAKLGTSDGHYIGAIGLCATYLEVETITLENIKKAIIDRKTIPISSESYDKTSRVIGGIMGWHDEKRRNRHS